MAKVPSWCCSRACRDGTRDVEGVSGFDTIGTAETQRRVSRI